VSGRTLVCWVSHKGTQQNLIFSPPNCLQTFLLFSYSTKLSILKFDTFLDLFAIFNLLISCKGFFWISQIWIGSDYNNVIKLVRKCYSWYLLYLETVLLKWSKILQALFNKHDHEVVAKLFLNCKKCKWILENQICQYIMISYMKVVVNFEKVLNIFFQMWCLEIEASHKKNLRVE
jgi:hypothetical protein